MGDDFTELCDNLDRYICEVVPNLPDADAFYQDRSRPETLKQMQAMGANDPLAVQLEPGDAAVHHCEVIHRADPNRSKGLEAGKPNEI